MTGLIQTQPDTLAADSVVSFEGVTKTFGGQNSVDSLSFEFPKGKIIGLFEPSGSGKTTTVRLMTGIYYPTEGQIRVLDSDPRAFTQQEPEKIGHRTQSFVLYPDLSVKENLRRFAALSRSCRLFSA